MKKAIPDDLNNLYINLKYIGQIQSGKKICHTDRSMVDSYSWAGSLFRTFKGESRKDNIKWLHDVICKGIEILKNRKYPEWDKLTLENLGKTITGLTNLCNVYQNDPLTISTVEVLIDLVEMTLERYPNLNYDDKYDDN